MPIAADSNSSAHGSSSRDRKKDLWPSVIEIKENNWLFTHDMLMDSVSREDNMTRSEELKHYREVFLYIVEMYKALRKPLIDPKTKLEQRDSRGNPRVLAISSEYVFISMLLYFRYHQRISIKKNKDNVRETALLCQFVASRITEVNVKMETLIGFTLQYYKQYVGPERNEWWAIRDKLEASELTFMERLGFDFIGNNPFEFMMTLRESMRDEELSSTTTWADILGNIKALVTSFTETQIFLLYSIEKIVLAFFYIVLNKYKIRAPKSYFEQKRYQPLSPQEANEIYDDLERLREEHLKIFEGNKNEKAFARPTAEDFKFIFGDKWDDELQDEPHQNGKQQATSSSSDSTTSKVIIESKLNFDAPKKESDGATKAWTSPSSSESKKEVTTDTNVPPKDTIPLYVQPVKELPITSEDNDDQTPDSLSAKDAKPLTSTAMESENLQADTLAGDNSVTKDSKSLTFGPSTISIQKDPEAKASSEIVPNEKPQVPWADTNQKRPIPTSTIVKKAKSKELSSNIMLLSRYASKGKGDVYTPRRNESTPPSNLIGIEASRQPDEGKSFNKKPPIMQPKNKLPSGLLEGNSKTGYPESSPLSSIRSENETSKDGPPVPDVKKQLSSPRETENDTTPRSSRSLRLQKMTKSRVTTEEETPKAKRAKKDLSAETKFTSGTRPSAKEADSTPDMGTAKRTRSRAVSNSYPVTRPRRKPSRIKMQEIYDKISDLEDDDL